MAKFQVLQYQTREGARPFFKWAQNLDGAVQSRVLARIERFEGGNLGEYRHLGGGLCESKLDFGPGYRIYFGIKGAELILLLCGGDKASQGKDIKKAKAYWNDYREKKP